MAGDEREGTGTMKRKPPKNDAQIDLFAPMFGDIASRDGINIMEFPFFSLSKKKRFEPIEYHNEGRGISITVSGGKPHGVATIWDKDVLIWCTSQIVEAIDRGEKPDKTIYFHPYQLLKAIRKGDSKRDYERLENAFIRLRNTSIHTTIRTDAATEKQGFSWIEYYRTATQNTTGEGIGMWSITLSEWVYQAALNTRQVLTIDDDYFLLMGGRERWLYGIARKHGGFQQLGFNMPLKTLYEKSATHEKYKFWAYEIRKIVKADDLPGYHLSLSRGADKQEQISFIRRSQLSYSHPAYQDDLPRMMKKRLLALG